MKGSSLLWILLIVAGISASVVLFPSSHVAEEQDNYQNNSTSQNNETKMEKSPSTPSKTIFKQFEQTFHNGCKGTGKASLTHSPMDPSKIEIIVPLGLMIGNHVTPIDHGYFYQKSGMEPYEVKSPAAGVVTSIQPMPGSNNDDWRIVIHHTCTLYSIYIHVNTLAPKLQAAVGSLEPGKAQTINTKVELEAGETFAYITNEYYAFDFQLQDEEVVLPGFIVPSHYDGESWKIHTVDFFDYFVEPVKSQLLAKNPRVAIPRGGKIDHDIDGRLIGNWFIEGTGGYMGGAKANYWETHLAFAPDSYDPTYFVVSMGNYNGEPKQFFSKRNAPKPEDVSVSSGIVKYELTEMEYKTQDGQYWNRRTFASPLIAHVGSQIHGVVLVQMISDRKIKFESFPGKTADQVNVFVNPVVYER